MSPISNISTWLDFNQMTWTELPSSWQNELAGISALCLPASLFRTVMLAMIWWKRKQKMDSKYSQSWPSKSGNHNFSSCPANEPMLLKMETPPPFPDMLWQESERKFPQTPEFQWRKEWKCIFELGHLMFTVSLRLMLCFWVPLWKLEKR